MSEKYAGVVQKQIKLTLLNGTGYIFEVQGK